MKKRKMDLKRIVVSAIVMVICLPLLFAQKVNAEEVTHRTVRVGYYLSPNYQDNNEDGTYSGFSYDYFMQIQKYTRWNYEFVEASYADCYKMLLNGEIDVMSGILKTPEREEQMIFSRYSVANSQNKLYARLDDENLFYESYDTFDGCKIALQQGVLTDEVEDYCRVHNFNAEILQYETMKDMEAALLSGEVDMVCASSISDDIQTKIVGRMDKMPLYYVTAKNEPEVAAELDIALQKIFDNNPDFFTQMSERYMISGANATATFTREELAYIQSDQPVYVIVNPNWAPITWYDETTKTYKGIFIDVINKIKEYSGLDLVLCTEDEFNEKAIADPSMIDNVVAILADDNGWAVQQDVMMSNHVVDSSVVMVTKRGAHRSAEDDAQIIALPKRFYIGYVMRNELKDKNIVYYDTVQDCLDAVNNGRADVTFVNELVSTYFLSMLEYSDLFATANSGYYENLAFAVNKESEVPLLSILDKSLLCIGTAEMEQMVVQNSIAEERFSLKGLYYSNPLVAILAVIFIVAVVFGLVSLVISVQNNKKRTELELKKEFETSNARTEFFMMISHEIRTPLNAIVGYLNLVEEQIQEKGGEMEYIKRSQNAAKQLTDIADGMLDYTRIASNTVEMRERLFDIKDVVLSVDQNISLRAAQKDLKYRFYADDITHEYVIGDQLRVAQIIQNLLSNAVKFTDEGGTVEARISEKVLENDCVELTFTCRDSGKGMSGEFLEKLCAPFSQSDKSYSRTHGGMGLGLFLTRYFIDAMHGTFQVESKVEEGSYFTVVLPLKRPNSEQLVENHVDCSHVRAIIGGVNTEESNQLKDLLKRLKIKSDVIVEPEKLVKRIRSRIGGEYEYTLCILDETMLEGEFSVIGAVAELNPSPAIFVMTGNFQMVDTLTAKEHVREVLYKPIFQSVLFDAVLNTFGEYEVQDKEETEEDFTGLRALIAEDNMVNADILTRILKKVHMEATVCENGKAAVDTFEQAPEGIYQIVFMDIQMPVMNGYEATEKIRISNNLQGRTIPIVAVSANAFPEDIEKSLQSGMNEHMSKPVNGSRLYKAIRKYCY